MPPDSCCALWGFKVTTNKPILLDNDVLLKLCCYQLGPHVTSIVCEDREIVVLGAAKFVVAKAISKHKFSSSDVALQLLDTLLQIFRVSEPTEEELLLAAELEDFAQANALDLDGGESQLLAMLIRGTGEIFLTGDKRAVRAIEIICSSKGHLTEVNDRIACLEQLIMLLIRKHSSSSIQSRICAESWVDKSLAICFSCATGIVDELQVRDALRSYINDLRRKAGSVLTNSDDLSTVIP